MTLEEKVAQMQSIWDDKREVFDAKLEFDPAKMAQQYPDGIGQFARPSDATGPASPRLVPGRDVRGTIRLVNALQHYATEHTRLGIPIMFHEEGLHGYAALGATSFPQAIALASSWDPALVREVNAVTAREIRARGVTEALTPVVDVARDPRWGRIEETFGEDPYLVGELGVAAVEGLQGEGKARDLRARQGLRHLETPHRTRPTGKRHQCRARALFGAQVAGILLPAVRKDHRTHRRERRHAVLQRNRRRAEPRERVAAGKVLRGEWGFKGAVVSDYYAIEDLQKLHHIAATPEEAARLALKAGVDIDLPSGGAYVTLTQQVRDGACPRRASTRAVRRLLALKFRAGLFEHPFADADQAVALTNNAEARALALKAAQRTLMLLKNDGTLPL